MALAVALAAPWPAPHPAAAAPPQRTDGLPAVSAAGGDADVLLSTLSVKLRWSTPQGATQTQIQVVPALNDGPGVNVILGDPAKVAAGEYLLAAPKLGVGNYLLLPGMSYAWRVRFTAKRTAVSEQDPSWSVWSLGNGFRTPAPSSAALQPVTPQNRATVGGAQPVVLQWQTPDTGLFYFEIQVSGDERFDPDPASATSFLWWNLIHGGETAPLNSWRTPPLEPGTRYFWRVRPRVQGDGVPAAWSHTWNFTTPSAPSAPAPAPSPEQSELEWRMVGLVNDERAKVGRAPLAFDPIIHDAARQHSTEMVERGYFAHNTPEGVDPFERMRSLGLTFGYAGENIADNRTMERAHTSLMNSPGHQANIVSDKFHRIGIGIVPTANGGVMVTQDFTD